MLQIQANERGAHRIYFKMRSDVEFGRLFSAYLKRVGTDASTR